MQFRYDQEADALMIRVRDDVAVSRTEQVDSGTLADLDRFGNVIAIEVIHPARNWPLDEISERFTLDAESAQMLRSLWAPNAAYPFAPAEAELVG